jgi:hypothetical protein
VRFLTPEGEPRAFVIVSSARSGSNLLVGYLRQVTQAACFGEVFRLGFVDKTGWGRLVERLDLPDASRHLHESDLTAFWELVLTQGLRRRRWLGAKAFYYHRRGDPVWDRFAESDHRVIHLWRDSTFDQYVSRLLAVASGEWKSPGGRAGAEESEPVVDFDRDDYVRYRDAMRTDFDATRTRYGGSNRYVEVEYRRLLDHSFVESWLNELFGERVDVEETLRQQRSRPKIDYLRDPDAAARFTADSISGGFAEG